MVPQRKKANKQCAFKIAQAYNLKKNVQVLTQKSSPYAEINEILELNKQRRESGETKAAIIHKTEYWKGRSYAENSKVLQWVLLTQSAEY